MSAGLSGRLTFPYGIRFSTQPLLVRCCRDDGRSSPKFPILSCLRQQIVLLPGGMTGTNTLGTYSEGVPLLVPYNKVGLVASSQSTHASGHIIAWYGPSDAAMMGSDWCASDDIEEDEEYLLDAPSLASQALPMHTQGAKPRKRRRISPPSEGYDSIEDFLDNDGSDDGIPRYEKSRLSHERGLLSNYGEEDKAKKKKSRHKIHIPRNHEMPPEIVQYGTQNPGDTQSSPYRIRGALWKLPKNDAPSQELCCKDPFGSPHHQDSRTQISRQVQTKATFDKPATLGPPSNPPRVSHIDIAQELADLPSDAFSSSPEHESPPTSRQLPQTIVLQGIGTSSESRKRLVAPQTGLRQTTLFGDKAPIQELPPSQVNKVHNYRVDMAPEPPTHHELENGALGTWIYPTNLGAIRDYQFNIVSQGLFSNTLVALPTGLGKTFIAATIMLNYFRWTKDAKIVFMAPTKPLVSQQVDACFNIVGIPRSMTTMLTGEVPPAVRAEEWQEKRVFFMTPQTLDNDLRSGIADPKKIVLLVVDEAHRATGNYSYVKVISFMRRFSKSFRVLALTATPGASVESVQEVIDGLEIAKVEIRTEESMDIQQFVHRRRIEQILLDPSEEMIMVQDLFAKALQPLVDKLCGQNAYWNKDPMSLTPFGLMKAREAWFKSDAGRKANPGIKGMMMGLFSILASVAHGIKLLNFHGIGPFYETIKELRADVEERGVKAGKYRKQINDSTHFNQLMNRIKSWLNKDDFMGHPKLTYLCDTILNHFLDAGEGRLADGAPPSGTRVIVFAEFRDSAEEICRVLNRHGPMIRASVFVGQADSKRSEGMNQGKQTETIAKFKNGVFNVIVATSIGEEGLDIGQVDLIVCYDSSASPVRMLQRMGRTGRKRAGNIVLLLMKGKEEETFMKAKDNYEQMQQMISSGTRFSFRHELSARIIPKDIKPVVNMRHVEIPPENTQDASMPEPKRRARTKTKAPKKFNMPDNVETGFMTASTMVKADQECSGPANVPNPSFELSETEIITIPELVSVVLGPADTKELERRYQNVYGDDLQEVSNPDMNLHPDSQRTLRATKSVRHGQSTVRFVNMMKALHNITESDTEQWQQIYHEQSPFLGHEYRSDESCSPSLVLSEHYSDPELPSGQAAWSKSSFGSINQPQVIGYINHSHSNATSDECTEDVEAATVRNSTLYARSEFLFAETSPPLIISHKPKPFFEPTQFSATQNTNDDDDLPDVGDLLCDRHTQQSRSPLKETQLDGNIQPQSTRRWKRRRVVVEEDSDE